MVTHCQICGRSGLNDVRLVRDHDHKTLMIRGIVCELCNSYLDIYERKTSPHCSVTHGTDAYNRWVRQHESVVKVYLSQDMGVHWHQRGKVKLPTNPKFYEKWLSN